MFLKPSSMEDNSTKARFFKDGDEIQLELCLSLGGSFGKTEKSVPTENRTQDKRDEKIVGNGYFSGGACVESLSKREIHALRRQEARKKREAKMQLQRRGYSCGGASNEEFPNGGGLINRGGAGAGERGCKRVKTVSNESLNGEINGVNLSFGIEQNACSGYSPVSQVQHPYPFPFSLRSVSSFGNSYINPDGKSKNMFQPHREDHQPAMEKNVGSGCGSGQVEENVKPVSSGSPVCSSSGLSDPRSGSAQGSSSCDSRTNSSPSGPDQQPPVNNKPTGPDQTEQSLDRSSTAAVAETREASNLKAQNSVTRDNGKPPKPQRKGNAGNVNINSSLLPFSQMPCVTTTGKGPEGKTVNGFLYRYLKSEVSIVCVCHGRSFSPEEFVRHAGGIEVSHPLRHITVIPSAI